MPTALDTGHYAALGSLGVLLVGGVFTELTRRRVPNALTVFGMATGLLLGYLPGGISLKASLGGLAIGFGLLFLFYMFGGMGGGDVKMMGAVGALLGYPLIVPVVMYTALVGGLMAILMLIWNGEFWAGMAGSLRRAFRRPTDATAVAVSPLKTKTIPYGLAITAGCLAALFLGPV
jgi:prepilin peptidase CpaA